ncbi:MAG: hypothetical protein LBE09_02680, partial [Christensenellaceae bacterium]|nr:hypothetical protein [Christensenellaceae bacterium]
MFKIDITLTSHTRLTRIVTLVLLIAIALTLCFDLLKTENKEGEIAVNAQDMPPQVMTQAINDADAHISFEFLGGSDISS